MIVEQSIFPLKKLSDYVFINIGKTPSRNVGKYWGKGHRWLSIADMKGDVYVEFTKEEITNEAIKETKIKIVPENTVIYSFKLSIGKTGITKIPIYTNEAIASFPIKDHQKLDTRYLYYVMREFDFAGGGVRAVMGRTLNKEKLEKIKIPLPPLPEQQRIAAILDAANTLRKKTQQIIDSYDDLAQSVFLDMFGDPVVNSKSFQIKSLKSVLVKIGSGATPKGGKESYQSDGISLIRSMNVFDNRFKFKDLAYISDLQARALSNVIVKEHDVLFNITGASVCRCCIVPEKVIPARVNQHVAILRPKPSILDSVYLNHLLISKNIKKQLLGISKQGGATREAITKEQLENYEIPIPPISLQTQFAQKIQLIEKQKELARQSLKESEDLFQALLQKAFKGELSN